MTLSHFISSLSNGICLLLVAAYCPQADMPQCVMVIGFGLLLQIPLVNSGRMIERIAEEEAKNAKLASVIDRAEDKAAADQGEKSKLIQSMDNWRTRANEYRDMLEKQAK